jgi:hypothetical protein
MWYEQDGRALPTPKFFDFPKEMFAASPARKLALAQ